MSWSVGIMGRSSAFLKKYQAGVKCLVIVSVKRVQASQKAVLKRPLLMFHKLVVARCPPPIVSCAQGWAALRNLRLRASTRQCRPVLKSSRGAATTAMRAPAATSRGRAAIARRCPGPS